MASFGCFADIGYIGIAARSGADCFVAGSAVYRSENPAAMVVQLRELANAEFI